MSDLMIEKIKDFPLPEISEKEYQDWKAKFEPLADHEKLQNVMNVLYQLFAGGECATSVYKSMFVCINRYIEEKNMEDFLN